MSFGCGLASSVALRNIFGAPLNFPIERPSDTRRLRFKLSEQMDHKQKKPLQPGRGLMDWIRVSQEKNLSGNDTGQPLRVSDGEIAKHSTQEDAWMIINGKVYNVGPYMEYHPGGIDQLMRAAGTDGTKLFNEKHPWVNYESMLKSCYVGSFVGSYAKLKPTKKLSADISSLSISAGASSEVKYPKKLAALGLRCDWKEDRDSVQMLIETKWDDLSIEKVVVECMQRRKLRVLFRTCSPGLEVIWNLPFDVNPVSFRASVSALKKGCLSVALQKEDPAILWREFVHDCTIRSTDERSYRPCRITQIEDVTHDTRLFKLDMPNGDSLPVPIGSHIIMCVKTKEDAVIERPYTPIIPSVQVPPNGVPSTALHFMIKGYADGPVTQYLWSLKEGASVDISDPYGSFSISKLADKDQIIMLAAGTGFTPMVRVVQHCLHGTKQKVTLLFFNKTQKDTLWRDQLEKLAEQYRSQFSVINVLSAPEDDWSGRKGRVSIDLLREFLVDAHALSKMLVLVCGPTGFVESSLTILREIGLQGDNVHVFQG